MEVMAIFGLIMMGVIAIALTHLANWLFRLGIVDRDSFILIFIGILVQSIAIALIYQLVKNVIQIYAS